MPRYDKPLTLEQIAAVQDEDIDFSDIPELNEGFWQDAKLVEPDRTEQITLRLKGLPGRSVDPWAVGLIGRDGLKGKEERD